MRDALTKHGKAGSSIYGIWHKMLRRCRNPDDHRYPLYGARGIAVCDRWSDFPTFYADMGDRPSAKHSIDRIDNDGPYSPENCRWATQEIQCNNRRGNHVLTYQGETLTLEQWSRRVGVRHGTISGRLRRGWSLERALTERAA